MDPLIRVASTSPPHAVAALIRKAMLDEDLEPTIRAIGAGAVAQACKGIAIARGLIAVQGYDLATNIGFATIKGDTGTDISAQTFHLFLT